MKNSRKLLILLRTSIFIQLLALVIPHPDALPINENFVSTSTSSNTVIENLSEIEASNGVTLHIRRGSSSRINVEAFGSSNCFLVDQSLNYANFYCDVARYYVEYDQSKEVPNLLIKSNLRKVYIEYNRIKNLDLRLTKGTCIINQLDSLKKLEVLGSINSEVELRGCLIDTLIIDKQTKLTWDEKSRIKSLVRQ
jgi:hypothetical protein